MLIWPTRKPLSFLSLLQIVFSFRLSSDISCMRLLSLFIFSDKGSSAGINWPAFWISFSLSVSLAKLVGADIVIEGVVSILISS
jgi:hypothetical protein